MNVSNNLDPLRVKEDLKSRGETRAIKCIEAMQRVYDSQQEIFGTLMKKYREQAKAHAELEKDYIALAKAHAEVIGMPVIFAEQKPDKPRRGRIKMINLSIDDPDTSSSTS